MSSTHSTMVTRHDGSVVDDELAVEEPLEIRLGFARRGTRAQRNIAITMRTPGHDADLAVGFLFGEGILHTASDVLRVEHCGTKDEPNENVIRVELADEVDPELSRLQRNFYTTSSCGVCGKSSLEALDVSGFGEVSDALEVSAALVGQLSERARAAQAVFSRTGGLHAAALFDGGGELVAIREDVGRHNAVDKLVGWALREGRVPLCGHLLFLSGRASFELLQKALAAQIPIVCAVGAPSSLAVDLAERFGITLLGFVRDERFNVYTHSHRVRF